jgi:hypothetical protein
MYEHRSTHVISQQAFVHRMARHISVALLGIGFAWALGAGGYHWFEDMPWIDAFLNAAMILGGMGPVDVMHTSAGKIFASCYALFSGVFFIGITSIVMAPMAHRLLHTLHVDDAE